MDMLKKYLGVVGVQVVEIDPPLLETDRVELTREMVAIAHRVADNRVVMDLRRFATFGENEAGVIASACSRFRVLGGKVHFVVNDRGAAYLKGRGLDREQTLGRTFADVQAATQAFVESGTEVA